VLDVAQGQHQTTSIAILAGWTVISVVAGVLFTRRRPVQ
jgi:hypothetical protein